VTIPLSCRCGRVRGEVETDRAYTRGTCYCKDCQAFARWLGEPGLMDAEGGTDVVPMAPTAVRFTSGRDQLACMSLSEKGLFRWYAACCRTPLGNTPRDPAMHYVGMPPVCFDAPRETVDAAFGPRDRITLNTGSATGPVQSTPFGFVLGGLSIVAHLIGARLRGERSSPFFDPQTGQPIRSAEVARPPRST